MNDTYSLAKVFKRSAYADILKETLIFVNAEIAAVLGVVN